MENKNRKHRKTETIKAKVLRKNMTTQENKLWHKYLKYYPIRILRQKVINYYIVDFYCSKAQLAIELDGKWHYEKEVIEYDKERSKILEDYGIKVIRIKNEEIDKNFYNTCKLIDKTIKQRLIIKIRQSPPC